MSSTHAKFDEHALLTRASRGDKQAFGILYEHYLEPVYRYVYYRVADHAEAEDLTEMVFLKAWEKLASMRGGASVRNFRAWIYRIAHNLVVDRHRTHRPSKHLSESLPSSRIEHSPENALQSKEEVHLLARAVSQLEEQLQQVIIHRFIHQLSHAETAQLMGLTAGHVRVLQHRALKKMRTLLVKNQ